MTLKEIEQIYHRAYIIVDSAESIPLGMAAKDMAALLDGPLDDGGSFTWAKLRTKVSMSVMEDLYHDMIQRGEKTNADFDRLVADLDDNHRLKRVDRQG